jgi:hypothetical protein
MTKNTSHKVTVSLLTAMVLALSACGPNTNEPVPECKTPEQVNCDVNTAPEG